MSRVFRHVITGLVSILLDAIPQRWDGARAALALRRELRPLSALPLSTHQPIRERTVSPCPAHAVTLESTLRTASFVGNHVTVRQGRWQVH